jgi:hypothetical protein
MLREMPCWLFEHWLAFARLKPFGYQERILAQLTQRVYNATRPEGVEPFDLSHFIPVAMSERDRKMHLIDRQLAKAKERIAKEKMDRGRH